MGSVRQSTSSVAAIGVGIDTARYGHHATFLFSNLGPAAAPLIVEENRVGYDRLKDRLERLHAKHPQAALRVRLDVAGQYAANLETFLRGLRLPLEISVGDPCRNDKYRAVHSPKRKADAVDSNAVARFAVVEHPRPAPSTPPALLQLREIAGRLQAAVREQTRHVNQLHNLLARVFPELAGLAAELKASWVVDLLGRYPTPARLANARAADLATIPYLSVDKAEDVRHAAAGSIASLTGKTAETLVRHLARQLRSDRIEKQRFEKLLGETYRALPTPNHLDSIVGFGVVTAAVLTAKIVDIARFERAEQLVNYFGVFPEERSSGIPAPGKIRRKPNGHMSRKGSDLVRAYLFNAARSASIHNPAAKALYARLRQRGTHGRVALGHVMRKLLHLTFAIWKSGKPFDREHYDWANMPKAPDNVAEQTPQPRTEKETAAGRNREQVPDRQAVTATESSA